MKKTLSLLSLGALILTQMLSSITFAQEEGSLILNPENEINTEQEAPAEEET